MKIEKFEKKLKSLLEEYVIEEDKYNENYFSTMLTSRNNWKEISIVCHIDTFPELPKENISVIGKDYNQVYKKILEKFEEVLSS